MKICTKCGEEKSLDHFYYRQTRGYHYAMCKFCHAGGAKPKNFANSWYKERFTAEELEIFSKLKYLWSKAKLRTKEVDLSIDWEYLFDLWEQQNGKCIYSGVPLSIEANHLHGVSLDRTDSSQGYVRGNLQLVSSMVNRMKQEFDEDLFIDMCERIVENKSTT